MFYGDKTFMSFHTNCYLFATYSVHISLKSAAYLFLIEPNYKFYNTELAEAAL